MLIHGTLTKWNDERGFGFITSALSRKEIFVHVSAFPSNTPRPVTGEALVFEIDVQPDGKQRAIRVQRSGHSRKVALSTVPNPNRNERGGHRFTGKIFAAACLAAIGFYLWVNQSRPSAPPIASARVPVVAPDSAASPAYFDGTFNAGALRTTVPQFKCDGRTKCSAMTSCEEAYFFLKNCPGVTMDGDNDGIPCEQQWCSSR